MGLPGPTHWPSFPPSSPPGKEQRSRRQGVGGGERQTEESARGSQSSFAPPAQSRLVAPGARGGPRPEREVWGLPGVLPVPRVDPAGGAARMIYVVDLAVEVARLLPALRQGQLRPGHLPERGPRSPMQLPAAAGAPGSAAPAGRTQPRRPPRHHDGGGGARGLGALVGAGRGGAAVHAALRLRPGAARCSRRPPLTLPCAPAAARCGPGYAPGRRGRASRAQLPPALLRRAARCALHAAACNRCLLLFLPLAGRRRPSPLRRSALACFATSASARCGSGGAGNRAAPETGGGALGAWVPGSPPRAQRCEGGS